MIISDNSLPYPLCIPFLLQGTALPLQAEFAETYRINVVGLPPHRLRRRIDHPVEVFMGRQGYLSRLEGLILESLESSRPVLVGTATLEQSETIHARLNALFRAKAGTGGSSPDVWRPPVLNLLNARPESVRREAQIIAQAGLPHTVSNKKEGVVVLLIDHQVSSPHRLGSPS